MKHVYKKSKKHLSYAEEDYLQHWLFAFRHGAILVSAGLALMLHSFVPGLHTSTASRVVKVLNWKFTKRNKKQPNHHYFI